MSKVFISGMFRSGTTFLARMLNVHSNIVCASDPLRPIFNSFRYDIANEKYKSNNDRFSPLNDYFLGNSDLLDNILNSNLNIDIQANNDDLIKNVLNAAEPYSKKWVDSFDKSKSFSKYNEFIEYSLSLVSDVYGNKDIIAFKEVWTNEFIPAFLRTFTDSKAIILIRDPRAIVASNIASGDKYPIFFLSRQWRKLAYLTKIIQEKFDDKVLIMRYEDLISSPEGNVKTIMNFLDLPYEETLLNISNYIDGNGNAWKKNTHYKDDKNRNKIDGANIDKWKNTLSTNELKFIELICNDWMKYFGYELLFNEQELLGMNNFPRYKDNELANWIQKFSFDNDENKFSKEVLIEKMRLSFINNSTSLMTEKDKKLLQIL